MSDFSSEFSLSRAFQGQGLGPNKLNKRFNVAQANVVWAADFTHAKVMLHRMLTPIRLFTLIDLATDEILYHQAGVHLPASLLVPAVVEKIVDRLREHRAFLTLYLHTDSGAEFTSFEWQTIPDIVALVIPSLDGVTPPVTLSFTDRSIPGKIPGQNAVIERYFGDLKKSKTFLQVAVDYDPKDPAKRDLLPTRTLTPFSSVKELNDFWDLYVFHYNHSKQGERSLNLPPVQTYAALRAAHTVLGIPDPPLAKNKSASEDNYGIQQYRLAVQALHNGAFRPFDKDEETIKLMRKVSESQAFINAKVDRSMDAIQRQIQASELRQEAKLQEIKEVMQNKGKERAQHVRTVPRDPIPATLVKELRKQIQDRNMRLCKERNLITIFLLIYTGIRCNEITQLKAQQLIDLAKYGRTSFYQPKTKKWRTLHISTANAKLLDKILDSHIAFLKEIVPHYDLNKNHIFYNHSSKKPMHPKAILRAVNGQLKQLQADALKLDSVQELAKRYDALNISSHSGRITFVTNLSKTERPLRTIQKMVGHSRLETTAIYERYDVSDAEARRYLDEVDKLIEQEGDD